MLESNEMTKSLFEMIADKLNSYWKLLVLLIEVLLEVFVWENEDLFIVMNVVRQTVKSPRYSISNWVQMIKTTMRPLRSSELRRVNVLSGPFLNQAILRPSCGATSAVCSQVCTPQLSQAGLAQAAEFSQALQDIKSGGSSSGLVYFSLPATRVHEAFGETSVRSSRSIKTKDIVYEEHR